MKENVFKGIVAAVLGGLSAYFGVIAIPLLILIAVMIIDYLSGLAKAWYKSDLSSRIGIVGAVKKALLYPCSVRSGCHGLAHK